MSRLIRGLFITTAPQRPLFDLHNNQKREYPVPPNAAWYNGDCEFLGWGDLAPFDYTEIAEDLAQNEMFVVLPPRPGPTTEGIDHVVENAWYVIVPGKIYAVGSTESEEEPYEHPQLGEISAMSREHLLDLLTSPVPAS